MLLNPDAPGSSIALALTVVVLIMVTIAHNAASRKPNDPDDKTIAQYDVGTMYYEGKGGVEKDYKKAFEWYTLSANRGYDKAQWKLAYMYANGEGVPQDYKQAAYWYEQGGYDRPAQKYLALHEEELEAKQND